MKKVSVVGPLRTQVFSNVENFSTIDGGVMIKQAKRTVLIFPGQHWLRVDIEEQEREAEPSRIDDYAEPVISTALDDLPGSAQVDRRPHSRACGGRAHPHGADCHSNCPTCHGADEDPRHGLPIKPSS